MLFPSQFSVPGGSPGQGDAFQCEDADTMPFLPALGPPGQGAEMAKGCPMAWV